MDEQTSPDLDYTLGFSEEFLDSLMRRTAKTHAAYLFPYLKSGMRLLDIACGPGSITVGLAQAVAPGEVYGIEIEESQVSMAQAVAARYQQANVAYQVADATDLPFDDGFFDVVHCHDALIHIPDATAVLTEAMRVLKPGGIVAFRELICGSSFTYPEFGVLDRAWEVFEDVIATADGHPQMGKELKTRLDEAGFVDSRISASFDLYATPEDVAFIHSIVDQWFLSADMQDLAISFGASSDELVGGINEAYDRWKDHPGAVCALAFGEAVAYKP